MKKLLTIFLLLILMFENVYADSGVKVNMDNITFDMLTNYSDQSDKVKVSRFYNEDKYPTFCIEPEITYLPNKYHYKKYAYDDEALYKIVKAYSLLDPEYNNDNLYIAAQIMIWKIVSGVSYTFDNKDYKEYIEIINDYIDNDFHLETDILEQLNVVSSSSNEIVIEGNYMDYEIDDNNIEIVSIDNEKLIINLLNDIKDITVKLKRKDDYSKQYLYSSVANDIIGGSQDLYSYESNFNNNDFLLKLMVTNEKYDLNFSKKDLNNNNIKDAEFTLYKINDASLDKLYFLKINNEVNLVKEILNIDDDNNYNIEVSERYFKYLNSNSMNTNEVGFFEYKILKNNSVVKQGKVYVCDDISLPFISISVSNYQSLNTTNNDINIFNNVEKNYDYYLCESEPARGYEFNNNPCKLIVSNDYNNEILEFININRKYNFKLLKNNREDILLNGALFKISYYDNDVLIEKLLSTGDLLIENKDNYKYLFYKHNSIIETIEVNGNQYFLANADKGRYYYYLSDNGILDESKFNDYVDVVDGGFIIDNLPYASKVIIEELKAPNGYMITEPKYEIYPDIKYSEITFSNYRVNEFEIIPLKRRKKIVKTCIDE